MKWTFRKMSKAEMNYDPVVGEFFNTDTLRDSSDALVRESIQNSLDAALVGPVRVRIARIRIGSGEDGSVANQFFRGLRPHLQAQDNGLSQSRMPKPEESMDVLLIEDFGTRGLRGEVTAHDDRTSTGDKNDFFYFWRNVGRGKKSGDDRGRWGMGKTVFPAASRINSFLALTLRSEDSKCYLMGQSVLKIHHVGTQKYAFNGYFGNADAENFVLPIDSSEEIDAFRNLFKLRRQSEPGLSVVVPHPNKDIDGRSIVRSVIQHYFHPILRGDLVVEIEAAGVSCEVSASTIDALAKQYLAGDFLTWRKLFDLARWGLSLPADQWLQLQTAGTNNAPDWGNHVFGDLDPKDLGKRFDAGERLAFKPQVVVKKYVDGATMKETSTFEVLIERDGDLMRPDDHFIRQGITVSDVHSLSQRGVRALVISQSGALATLLGDAENPAHTQWNIRSGKLGDRYETGPSTVGFVKNAPKQIVQLLNAALAEADIDALSHMFYVEDEPTPTKGKPPPGGEQDDKPPSNPEIPPSTRNEFSVSKVDGGFRVVRTKESSEASQFKITVAYDVARGNPFKRWSKFDFDLASVDLTWSAENANLVTCRDNVALVVCGNGDAAITCVGFDFRRDLIVDVKRVEQPNA